MDALFVACVHRVAHHDDAIDLLWLWDIHLLASRLSADPEFSLASLEAGTRALAAELGIKAGELIGITRVALTGRNVSPGIFEIMWLLGKEKVVARLREAAERWSRESPQARV